MARRPLHTVDSALNEKLVERFAAHVLVEADLPRARESDVRGASEFWLAAEDTLGVTCTITGSSYERSWDGSMDAAVELADEAADGTAYLITKTPHYAWLRSSSPP
jgi:hypothetical protein